MPLGRAGAFDAFFDGRAEYFQCMESLITMGKLFPVLVKGTK